MCLKKIHMAEKCAHIKKNVWQYIFKYPFKIPIATFLYCAYAVWQQR